jgi:exopolyphosphatase/pppGpp-phosphohydrolase
MKVNTKDYKIVEAFSMPVGAVRCSGWLSDNYFVQSLQKIFIDYRQDLDKLQTRDVFCVAGTVTSLGNMHLERKEFFEDDVHGMKLKTEDLDQLFKKYSDLSPEKYLELFPFLGKRSESIRGGLHLTYHLVHRLFAKTMTISTYGLRYGTLLEGKIKEEDIYKGA